jgi:hypothetical protein
LDSLVRNETYQWVTREFRRGIFRVAFAVGARASGWHAHNRRAEGTDCSWGKLNSISGFLQEIAARAERSYDAFRVNIPEAEARRVARFEAS